MCLFLQFNVLPLPGSPLILTIVDFFSSAYSSPSTRETDALWEKIDIYDSIAAPLTP